MFREDEAIGILRYRVEVSGLELNLVRSVKVGLKTFLPVVVGDNPALRPQWQPEGATRVYLPPRFVGQALGGLPGVGRDGRPAPFLRRVARDRQVGQEI